MITDILTKFLPKIKHSRCTEMLRLSGTSIGGVLERSLILYDQRTNWFKSRLIT